MNTTMMMPRRFFYHVRSTETGCVCVTQDALDAIARETQGEYIGNCVIQSDHRAKRSTLKTLETAYKVTIELRDSVETHARWLLAVAKTYPEASIQALMNAMGKHEFSAFVRA